MWFRKKQPAITQSPVIKTKSQQYEHIDDDKWKKLVAQRPELQELYALILLFYIDCETNKRLEEWSKLTLLYNLVNGQENEGRDVRSVISQFDQKQLGPIFEFLFKKHLVTIH